jgi:hypothetical protein
VGGRVAVFGIFSRGVHTPVRTHLGLSC